MKNPNTQKNLPSKTAKPLLLLLLSVEKQMRHLNRSLSKPRSSSDRVGTAVDCTVNAAGIKCFRDRGLDHAVGREKNLRPVVNIKNLIKSEPSKSLPISIIAQQRESLRVPTRPIEFIRSYPSIFQEFLPGGIGIHPHVKLTPEVLDIDAEEQLVYQSESYKQDVADRLLKLLMISRINKIPLSVLDVLKWDLGLPEDYLKSIVPEFPDYFRAVNSKSSAENCELELVCWSNELAVSLLEKKEKEYSKGMPIAFPMTFAKGFEMDKTLRKWLDEWQKLPYVSAYENAAHLPPKTDESDKWAAAILHEVLNLFVTKKAERDDVLCFGEYLGIRSRFKRVLLHHPGVFYLSSKIGTYTVVLREAYKRGMLIESNPLIKIRSQYIHLMNAAKEESNKAVSVPSQSKNEEKVKEKQEILDGDSEEDAEKFSASEVEDEDDNEGENRGHNNIHKDGISTGRWSRRKNMNFRGQQGDADGQRGRRNGRVRNPRDSRSRIRLLTERQTLVK